MAAPREPPPKPPRNAPSLAPPPLPPPPSVEPRLSPSRTGRALESQLLSSLECPVCFEYMAPPIPLCENGHSLCSTCANRLRDCPTCRRPMLQRARNLALESLARGLRYPCRFASSGCAAVLEADALADHVSMCPLRPMGCPLSWCRGPEASTASVCPWTGPLSAARAHLRAQHPRRASEFPEPAAAAVIWEISQAGCFRDYTHVIFAFGQAFVYHKRFVMRDKKLFFAVGRAPVADQPSTGGAGGGEDAPPTYRYKFKMTRRQGEQRASFSSAVHSLDDDLETLIMSGVCISVDFETLVAFGKTAKRVFSIRRVGARPAPAPRTPGPPQTPSPAPRTPPGLPPSSPAPSAGKSSNPFPEFEGLDLDSTSVGSAALPWPLDRSDSFGGVGTEEAPPLSTSL